MSSDLTRASHSIRKILMGAHPAAQDAPTSNRRCNERVGQLPKPLVRVQHEALLRHLPAAQCTLQSSDHMRKFWQAPEPDARSFAGIALVMMQRNECKSQRARNAAQLLHLSYLASVVWLELETSIMMETRLQAASQPQGCDVRQKYKWCSSLDPKVELQECWQCAASHPSLVKPWAQSSDADTLQASRSSLNACIRDSTQVRPGPALKPGTRSGSRIRVRNRPRPGPSVLQI